MTEIWTAEGADRLGQAVKRLRGAEGLTQEKLAYAAGLTKNQVQLIESGRASGRKDAEGPSNPRLSTLAGLAEALGVTVSELLAEAGL